MPASWQHLRSADRSPVLSPGHACRRGLRGTGGRRQRLGGPAMTGHTFVVEGLHASAGGRDVLHGIDLEVKSGEVHVVMGPNGSGKSTLANALMGRPGTTVTKGSIR